MTKFRSNNFYVCVHLEETILEEIMACERMTHKNLTQNLHMLYQLTLLLFSTKSNGGHHIRLEDISEQTLQTHHVLPPLLLFFRHLYGHAVLDNLHQEAN